MRIVVHGAGGIGGAIAARLHQHGHDVVAIARGEHLDAWRKNGLRLQTPDDDVVVDVPVAGHPEEVGLRPDDVVLLTMKGQDTVAALDDLGARCPDLAVVCAQNGVANEREALRRFDRVYGICVMMPTSFVEPGVVQAGSSPVTGILDVGRYPDGVDDLAHAVASVLCDSTFASDAVPDIMRWKHAKLLMNLGNALQAVCAPGGTKSLYERLRAEGEAVFAAAGIAYASAEEDRERRGGLLQMRPVGGQERGGGSSWQSLVRGTGAIETDLLNGEIVLLGRMHGVPTPVNALFQRLAKQAARERRQPGFLTAPDIEEMLGEG